MKLKINILITAFFLSGMYAYSQIGNYSYKREIKGVDATWHAIELPDEMFEHVASDLSDIRLYGITKENDTIEAPYILKKSEGKRLSKAVDFEMINKSSTSNGVYTTYKIPSEATINQIKLFLNQDNFDNLVSIEGGQDLKNWYTIVEEYRILSIKNQTTSYSFTTINFPDSKYQYYKIFVKGKKAPLIQNAQIVLQEIEAPIYNTNKIKSFEVSDLKKKRKTTIDIGFENAVPLSYLKIDVNTNFDYYRPIRIEYLNDSIKTQNGWKYKYQRLVSGVLNSIDGNEFRFRSIVAKKIRVVVSNQDSEPLTFTSAQAKGYRHEIIARFTKPATYYLIYGNPNDSKPSYDLQYVSNKIPADPKKIQLEGSVTIDKKVVSPLFENKIWLWLLMFLVIVLLGGFTLMMMKKK